VRVLIFINTSWNIVNFRSGLIKALQKRGFEVLALAPEDDHSARLPAMGVSYHPIAMDNSGTNPVRELALIKRIYKIYSQLKPQVVLHYTIKPNIYGCMAARWNNIPCINNISGLGTSFLVNSWKHFPIRMMYRNALKYPHKIFFQNSRDLQQFENWDLLKKPNYELIPGSGVNTAYFKPTDSPSNRPFTFLMMARLLEEKGVREYALASEIMLAKGLQMRCILAGNPEIEHRRGIPSTELQKWVDKGFVEYLGEVSDVRPIIGESHAVVLPSYREGLPKSLLEAASMGKPVIATKVPGCTDVVKDQINGLLCEPRNAWDLAEKMEQLYHMSNPELQQLGNAGRKLAQNEFEENLVIEKYLKTIQHILDQ